MDKPIRVLHVIGIMNRGGAETMIMNLYRNIDRNKVQFDFVENTSQSAVFDEEIQLLGGRIYRCPHYNGKNHIAYCKWWNHFFDTHKNEYAIVHGHLGSTAAIYLSIAKKHGVYGIAHSHNTNLMKSPDDIIYALFAFPTRFIADHFFACSREAGVSRYGKRVGNDENRCTILANAIDISKFVFNESIRQRMRDSLGITENQLVIGNISRFAEQKNHLFLIDIFEKIREKSPDAVLLLVGDGERRPQIEAHILEKNLSSNTILTGIQSNTWDFYQAMDVFLMPSLYEGLPVSMVEAQTSGLPCCVSTSVPREAAITDLVQFHSLSDSAEKWCGWVLGCTNRPRRNMKAEIQKAGYDISVTSKWLENFYMNVVTSRGKQNQINGVYPNI